jgi:transcriptional coactivator p15 (PC4)
VGVGRDVPRFQEGVRLIAPVSDPIAIIPKNNIDEIRVMWSEFKGHRYLDIRVYTEVDGQTDKMPTKKGVTLRSDLIPDLIKALESAQSSN